MVGWLGGWLGGNQVENHATLWSNLQDCKISSRVEIPKLDPSPDKFFDLAVGGWLGGNQVENHATKWFSLQGCKISRRVEIPKLDPSVGIIMVEYAMAI